MNSAFAVLPANDSRRRFFQVAGMLSAALVAAKIPGPHPEDRSSLPPAFSRLKPLGARVRPVEPDEFSQRIEGAQQLMSDAAPKFDALFFAPGSSLYYFTGIRWGLSERLLGLVIPRTGRPILVVPGFEEGRLREKLHLPLEVRIWQEDQSPTKVAASALADQGVRSGRIGMEETTSFTFFDHFRQAAPAFDFLSADPITIACRPHKSA